MFDWICEISECFYKNTVVILLYYEQREKNSQFQRNLQSILQITKVRFDYYNNNLMYLKEIYSDQNETFAVVIFEEGVINVKKVQKKPKSNGKWTIEQNSLYFKFLKENKVYFETKMIRKCSRIFRKMSKVIVGRRPEQCRSHHQKFEIMAGEDYEKIIQLVEAKLEKQAQQNQQMNQRQGKEAKNNQKIFQTQEFESKKITKKLNANQQPNKGSIEKRKYNLLPCFRIFLDVENISVW